LGLLLLAGCLDGGPPLSPPGTLPLTVQLGSVDTSQPGGSSWLDLADGQPLQLVPGSQGGFHVWLLYRVSGNSQQQPVRISRLADRLDPSGRRDRVLTAYGTDTLPAQPSWQLLTPIANFMCPTPIGVNILNAPVELSLTLTPPPPSGQPAGPSLGEAHVTIQPVCPPSPDPQHDFCQKICQG
jgi:hypothetical protein